MKNKIIYLIAAATLILSGVTAWYSWQKAETLGQVTVYHESYREEEAPKPVTAQLNLSNDKETFQAEAGSSVLIESFAVPVEGTISYDGVSLITGDITIFGTASAPNGITVKHYAATDESTVTIGIYGTADSALVVRRNDTDEENTITDLLTRTVPSNGLQTAIGEHTLTYDTIVINKSAIKLTIGGEEVYLYPFGGKIETLKQDEETGIYSGEYKDKETGLSAFVFDDIEILAESEDTVKKVFGL